MDSEIAVKITQAILRYEAQYPDEFKAYKKQKNQISELMANEFGALKGDHVMQRELFSLPETLAAMIKMALTDEEYKQIWDNEDKTCAGAKWFAKTFPQYRTGKRF